MRKNIHMALDTRTYGVVNSFHAKNYHRFYNIQSLQALELRDSLQGLFLFSCTGDGAIGASPQQLGPTTELIKRTGSATAATGHQGKKEFFQTKLRTFNLYPEHKSPKSLTWEMAGLYLLKEN